MENGNAGNRGGEWIHVVPNFERPAGTEVLQEVEQSHERGWDDLSRTTPELKEVTTEPLNGLQMPPETAIVDTGTVDDDNPATAEDGEKIEKEWAERVQNTVNEYKHDPRNLNTAVNRLKADYMKKRFNRELGDRN